MKITQTDAEMTEKRNLNNKIGVERNVTLRVLDTVYAWRAGNNDSRATASSGGNPVSSSGATLLMLSGAARTDNAGEYQLTFGNGFTDNYGRFAGPFELPGGFGSISREYLNDLRLVFIGTPQVIVSPTLFWEPNEPEPQPSPVLVTTRLQVRDEAPLIGPGQSIWMWDLNLNLRRDLPALPPGSHFITVLFQSWSLNGQPLPNVGFNWQMLGDIRFFTVWPWD